MVSGFAWPVVLQLRVAGSPPDRGQPPQPPTRRGQRFGRARTAAEDCVQCSAPSGAFRGCCCRALLWVRRAFAGRPPDPS